MAYIYLLKLMSVAKAKRACQTDHTNLIEVSKAALANAPLLYKQQIRASRQTRQPFAWEPVTSSTVPTERCPRARGGRLFHVLPLHDANMMASLRKDQLRSSAVSAMPGATKMLT